MKIALVAAHYIPRLGYLEVHLSKAFSNLEHNVQVFTTDVFPSYLKHQEGDFGTAPGGVKVNRYSPIISFGQIARVRGLKKRIREFQPELIVVIGLGKWFPKPVYDLNIPIYTLLGDNAYTYAKASWKSKLLFELFKRSTYQKALKKSARIYHYTPETPDVVGSILGKNYKKHLDKSIEITLGYWSNEFFFDQKLRNEWRAKLGFGHNDKVVITATRIVAEKKLEDQIAFFKDSDDSIKWLILGASDNAYSKKLQRILESNLGKERFILLPYASRSELNNYYNAADLALFTVPAISIFEALGAGLKLRIPEVETLSRLTKKSLRASIISEPLSPSQFDYNRMEVASEAEREFEWQNIARKILVENPVNS